MHHIVFQVVPQESSKALSNKMEKKKNSFIIKLLMAQMAHNLLASNDFYR